MVCWKCNKSGRCRGCACKKASKPCQNCLPERLGQCENTKPVVETSLSQNSPDHMPNTSAMLPTVSSTDSRPSSIMPTVPISTDHPLHSISVIPTFVNPQHQFSNGNHSPPILSDLSMNVMMRLSIGNLICLNSLYLTWERHLWSSSLVYLKHMPLKGMAIKATIVLPPLVLQRPFKSSKQVMLAEKTRIVVRGKPLRITSRRQSYSSPVAEKVPSGQGQTKINLQPSIWRKDVYRKDQGGFRDNQRQRS